MFVQYPEISLSVATRPDRLSPVCSRVKCILCVCITGKALKSRVMSTVKDKQLSKFKFLR